MKYCPFCGATLVDSAAFCMECGKPIPAEAGSQKAADNPAKPKRSIRPNKQSKPKKDRKEPKETEKEKQTAEDPQDIGYDGYYDDVVPSDNGHEREKFDPALLKRIILVAVGALVIVALSIVIMYIL